MYIFQVIIFIYLFLKSNMIGIDVYSKKSVVIMLFVFMYIVKLQPFRSEVTDASVASAASNLLMVMTTKNI